MNAGSAAKGVTYAAAFAATDTRPVAKKFVKMVKDKYGVVPGHDFSQMMDLLDILEIALKVKFSGDLAADRNKVRDAIMATTDFRGLASGPINFCKSELLSVEMVTEHL